MAFVACENRVIAVKQSFKVWDSLQTKARATKEKKRRDMQGLSREFIIFDSCGTVLVFPHTFCNTRSTPGRNTWARESAWGLLDPDRFPNHLSFHWNDLGGTNFHLYSRKPNETSHEEESGDGSWIELSDDDGSCLEAPTKSTTSNDNEEKSEDGAWVEVVMPIAETPHRKVMASEPVMTRQGWWLVG